MNDNLTTLVKEQLPTLVPAGFAINELQQEPEMNDGGPDLRATMKTPTQTFQLVIEVKNADRIASMRDAARQAKRYADMTTASLPMVAGMFLGERTREALKEEGVGYVDLAGNFYLSQPNFYAEKVVDRNPFTNTPPLKNLFAPVSSRITRTILTERDRTWTLRDLSKEAGVSLGQTFNVFEAMAEQELVKKDTQGKWTLPNPTALLEAWRKVYPTYPVHRYTFFSYEPDYQGILDTVVKAGTRSNLPYALGFFSGADLVAPFIRGLSKVQLYTSANALKNWERELNLREVQSGGNVELYIPYDKGVMHKIQQLPTRSGLAPVVSNVQLYMDLINNPARGEEAATHLREQKLTY